MAACRSAYGRAVLGSRTACAFRPFIRSLPLLSRKPSTGPDVKHRLANPGRLGTSRRYVSTHISRVQQDPCRNARLDDSDLVLSDAQRRTIYALSTPPGKGGVAVIRISGPDALRVWDGMVDILGADTRAGGRVDKGKARESAPEPWKMYRCQVAHPGSQEVLDDGLAVFFRGPKSFTTEDVVELHVHSGRAIISSVLHAISSFPFCRPAEPGEFTRRAFDGGRLDLTQVEGLRDLIDAETEGQRKLALRTAEGATRARLEKLRGELVKCLALVEALIDFGEGEDIEEGLFTQARERAQSLRNTIKRHLSDNRRGEITRTGIRLAIFGPPNAGKSSLLNFLARREAAIVTPIPGTTRDILELSLDIGGLPVIVADTAGLRKTDDVVEMIGIERARELISSADVSLCVLSSPEVLTWSRGEGQPVTIPSDIAPLINKDTFVLLNKTDLTLPSSLPPPRLPCREIWSVSLSSGDGTQAFMHGFAKALQARYNLLSESGAQIEDPLITHSRHRAHLESALSFLDAFLATDDVVLAAEELRYAAQAIGRISGIIEVDHVLDAVFRDFCIGK